MTIISHPNRPNKRKQKKGRGCKMCKPHKGKWDSFFKSKEKLERDCQYIEDDILYS